MTTRPRRPRSPRRQAIALLALLTATVSTLAAAPAHAAATCARGWTAAYLADGGTGCQSQFTYTGTVAKTSVPSGIPDGRLRVTVRGAGGGQGGNDGPSWIQGGAAGKVGVVTGPWSLPAGTVIEAAVGSAGGTGATCTTGVGAGAGGANPWPQYAGGSGANPGPSGCSGAGGGGGAASVLVAHARSGDLTVVAAGAGGGGGASLGGVGGAATAFSRGSGSTKGAPGEYRAGDNGGGGGGGGGIAGGAGGPVVPADPEWVGAGGESGQSAAPAGLVATSEPTGSPRDGSVVLEYALPGLTNIPPVVTVAQGATPFIAMVTVRGLSTAGLSSASFSIVGKPGSAAPAVAATYSAATLAARGYLDSTSFTVPVHGLYQSYSNSVLLSYVVNGSRKSATVKVATPAWTSGASGQFAGMNRLVGRDRSVRLDYGFIALKYFASANTPVVLDTDGEVRWIGPDFTASQPALFEGNDFYAAYGTSLARIRLDGKTEVLADYSSLGVTGFHHNFDKGRDGILMQVDRGPHVESTVIEAGTDGKVKRVWDLEQIVADAMRAGGDDPSNFVRVGVDWLHTNATAYWKAQDQLVVSGREDFVMGVDYNTGALKWLLGDMTKAWAQYPSLRKLALKVTGEPPVGQHAVSFTARGELMLFDNGTGSFNAAPGAPAGISRGYAAPRKYKLNLKTMTAAESWNYEHGRAVFSPICSSIYEFGSSLLVNYASEGWGAYVRLLGLDRNGKVGFEYQIPGNWALGWNASPISLTSLKF